MKFAITADDVRSVFGLTGVVLFPHYDAPHNGLSDRTAHLLSAVGLPDTAWFMSKASLRTDDPVNLISWYGSRGAVPSACRHWLVLGLFAETTLALDPDEGTVYALADGEEEINYSPIHRDVESLVYALTKFGALLQELESDGEGVGERVDALRGEITEFDPLPFADEESPWNLVFEEVIDGIW
ncbi:SUKH-4 family immunity protein [Streptomyces sp. st140]|uniref:SUKH-4 family immunity protein n=1 Tax=Streptomyces sp. st140 TaxID=1828052 RepID=UPI000BF16C49|nr:SUKH-4 family immunity protein [Streptomyces sp. st140]